MATATDTTAAARWVDEFAAGWRDPADPDSFADHFDRIIADDIRLIQPQLPTTVGRRAFREAFVRPLFELIPDLHARVDNWSSSGNVIFIEITLEGTLGGRPVTWGAVDRLILHDGVAIERRSYLDPLPLLAAVATRPRAWPRFARLQLDQLRKRVKGNQ